MKTTNYLYVNTYVSGKVLDLQFTGRWFYSRPVGFHVP